MKNIERPESIDKDYELFAREEPEDKQKKSGKPRATQ